MEIEAAIFFLVLLFFRAVSPVTTAEHCRFPAIFNFGDSNSDTGGLSAAFGPAPAPNGESFFGRPAGRYCDGRLIIDFLAESVGLPHLSAYLDSLGSNFSHGANFATAGSTVLRQNTTLFQSGFSPFSLEVQFWQYSQFQSRSAQLRRLRRSFTNALPGKDDFSKALYTFDIGQNDLTSAYFSNKTTAEVEATVPLILNLLSTIIRDIYWQGGRYFWVHNTGPFGCLAYVLARRPDISADKDAFGCGKIFNKVAQSFNSQLKDALLQLRKEFDDAVITYVDVYRAKYTLIAHARKLGFGNPLRACCGHGGKYNYNQQVGCGGTIQVNKTTVLLGKSCSDPSAAVNWDGVHYTQAANRFVFEKIVTGAYSDPPLPLLHACRRLAN